jgi:hypothetical protein
VSCVVWLTAGSQTTHAFFFELKNAVLNQPRLIGKTDNHFIVLDLPEQAGTPVYCFDSSFDLVSKTYLSSKAYYGDAGTDLHTVRLSWLDMNTGYLTQKIISVADGGMRLQDKSISLKLTFRSYYALRKESDKHNHFQLFYGIQEISQDSCRFTGVLLDNAGNPVKEMTHMFSWRPEFQQDPKVLLDVNGNIHILTCDRLNTYRISTEVVINTIPLESKEMSTANYLLHKVKFDKFLFSDNVKQQKIQVQGIYFDGQEKVRTGVASFQFDYMRNPEMRSRVTPVTEEFKNEMRAGLSHLHKRDNVLNSLYPKDIFLEKDGNLLITANVKDISEKEVKRDRGWEQMQTKATQDWWKSITGNDGKPVMERWLADAAKTPVYLTPVVDTRNPGILGQEALPAFPDQNRPVYNSAFAGNYDQSKKSGGSAMFQRQSYANRSEKLVYWILDDLGNCKRYGIIDDNIFHEKDTAVLQLLSYPLLQDKNYAAFSGQDPISRQGALSSILRIDKKDNENWLFPINYKNDTVLYLPFTNDNGQYSGLYKNNKTGKYGITFIQPD